MIRKAEIKDLNQLKKLEGECFDKNIRENFEFVLSNDNYVYFVNEEQNNIIAYVGASISYEQGDILSICVDSTLRNKGIASSILKYLIEYLKDKKVNQLFLEVEEENLPAVNLYKKFGFKEINKRKNYYGNKTAIIMLKVL